MRVGRSRFSSHVLRAFPAAHVAQAIAGVVHDASGAALPDVAVQAESSALIEKVRTVVTDGSGQYRIEDLRPGTYTVTFTRAGFGPYVRDGVEITSAFTASVNAQLAPGGFAETITVTAAAPAVDVRSAAAATTLRRRYRQGPSDRSQLQRARRAHTWGGHQRERRRDRHIDHGISDPRRARQRGPPGARRLHRRRSGGRQFGDQLRGGRRRHRGGHLRQRERAGRERNRWTRREPRAENRRQLHARLSLFQRDRQEAPVRQPDARSEAAGRHRGEPAQQGLRRLGHDRRTDRQGSFVVLRDRAPGREHDGQHERLLQPQRRGPGEVVLCTRHEPESVLGPPLRERQRACHVAGDPAQQGQRLLGRAVALSNLHGRDARRCRSSTRVA